MNKTKWGSIEEQKSIHENVNHGTVNFPYAIYHVRMPFHITSYPLHWHKEIEFIYVIDGTLTVSVNSRKFEMNRGDISVILPEQAHALFQYENVEANYINIVFNRCFFSFCASLSLPSLC